MKTKILIEMIKSEDYEKTKLCSYLYLISKLIYLTYDTRSDIAFIVKQLSKYNSNLRKNYLLAAKKVV